MSAQSPSVRELSTAQGNTLSVVLDLYTGEAEILSDSETARRTAEADRRTLARGADGIRIIARKTA